MTTTINPPQASGSRARPYPASRRTVVALATSDIWLVAVAITAAFTLAALWRALIVHQAVGDALSRTYSALVVLHSSEPKLAAMGLIWPPLPTLAQLPLLAVAPAAAFYGLSGSLTSAIAAGLTAAVTVRLLRRLGLGRWSSLALAVLLFANPVMAFYAGNGMSEMPFLLFLVLASDSFLAWAQSGQWQSLIFASFACAAMFLCRFDGALVTAVMAGGIVPIMWFSKHEFNPPKAEANLLTFLAPPAYVGMLFVYFNWMIMGDPLYFYRSEYSNLHLTQQMRLAPEVQNLQRSLPATLIYFLNVVGGLSPLLVAGVVVGLVVALWRRDVVLISLIAILLAAPAFQLWSYRSGSTFALPRFYISVIPAGIILAAYLLPAGSRRRAVGLALVVALILAGAALSFRTMIRQEIKVTTGQGGTAFGDDRQFVEALRRPLASQAQYADDLAAARYLQERVNGRAVLVDSVGSVVVLMSGQPALFFVPSDSDWNRVARTPAGHARYLVAVQRETQEFHAFQDLYPDLFEAGTSFTRLEAEFGSVRIYRVVDQRP